MDRRMDGSPTTLAHQIKENSIKGVGGRGLHPDGVAQAHLLTHKEEGYGWRLKTTDTEGKEGGDTDHGLTSCQTATCFSTSSGRFPKLSENISDKSMISSHPWSDNQAQGFFRRLFSREMFPNLNRRREVNSQQQCAGRSELLQTATSPRPASPRVTDRGGCVGLPCH